MKLIDKAIQELTEARVKKIKFGKGQPKGVDPLKPKKQAGDTNKKGADSETTKKGSSVADQDITTGEHYQELDREAKRQKQYKHSLSGDYDKPEKDVVSIHEGIAEDFANEMHRAHPSSEVDRIRTEFMHAHDLGNEKRMWELYQQLREHNQQAGIRESQVDRMLHLAGLKDVREMLVVRSKEDLDEQGKNKKRNKKQEHGLLSEEVLREKQWGVKKTGEWEGMTKEQIRKVRDRLRAKEDRTDEETRRLRAANFALRAKGKKKWGKAK